MTALVTTIVVVKFIVKFIECLQGHSNPFTFLLQSRNIVTKNVFPRVTSHFTVNEVGNLNLVLYLDVFVLQQPALLGNATSLVWYSTGF